MTVGDRDRVLFLDGLRAAASLAVVLQHYLESVAHQTFLPVLQFAPGLIGVVLFFCISGYVIPFSIKGRMQPIPFMLRRVMRIMPLYVCVVTGMILLGIAGLSPFAERIAPLQVSDYLSNFLLIYEYTGSKPVLGVAWTLSVEFAWYAFFVTYFIFWGHQRVAQACLAFSGGMIVLALISLGSDIRLPLGRVGMIGAAFMGYAICCWHLGILSRRDVARCILAFAGATAISQWVSFGYFQHASMSLFNVLSAWMVAITVFVGLAASPRLCRHEIWASPALATLGRLSFGMYLLHMPVFLAISGVVGGVGLVLLAVAVTLVLAELTYRWIERPGIASGRWMARSLAEKLNTRDGVPVEGRPGV
ncbi:MAG: acyltransferase [Pseudomonadota bacterium]